MDNKTAGNYDISQVNSVNLGESLDYKESTQNNEPDKGLHEGLQSRHVAMIALGGSLGTGLLIGT